MKIAIVHYHLRQGGVTQVIESTCAAFRGTKVEILVFSGEAPSEESAIESVVVFPGLNYRKAGSPFVAEGLVEALQAAAIKHFGSLPNVWHFHNHSLGKNVLMPLVVKGLADLNQRLLLQLHDFPEDGRPQNYVYQRNFFVDEKQFADTLYPSAPQVHYATINSRDRNFLKSAGMKTEQLHYLPNSVTALPVKTPPLDRPFFKDKRFLLYPTRAIRRKNIGEILLLALAHRDTCSFGTSLIPDNPEWQPVHDRWQALAEELQLPVDFGMAEKGRYRYSDLVEWSDGVITTSVAEGFGLAFLEPWLNGKIVLGRNLPRITSDFSANGVNLGHLYERINIPLEWIDRATLREEADNQLRRIYLAYNCSLPRNAADLTLSRWIEDDAVDFGMLSEPYQIEILRKAAADPIALRSLHVPPLDFLPKSLLHKNRETVEAHYSRASYRENLEGIYEKIIKSSLGRVQSHRPEKILKEFLDPWRLNLLRT